MDSTLNPYAPDFLLNLKKVTQDGYSTFKRTVKASKVFSADGKFDTLTKIPACTSVISDFSGYVSAQTERILLAEIPEFVFTKREGNQCIEEYIAQSNNNILERVNRNIDALSDMDHSKASSEQQFINADPEVDEQHLVPNVPQEAASLPPAQAVNTENLWVPIIFEKPNALEAFQLKLLYDEDGQPCGYEHPYKLELDSYNPPEMFTARSLEPIPFPAPLKHTNYKFVNSEGTLEDLVCHLREVDEIAIDLEHHSYRSYTGFTCLIQISTYLGDYIIDAVALRRLLYKLNHAFTDPSKIKVLHGADMDVMWLQRDFGVYIVGLFDTHQAAKTLKLQYKSLQGLMQLYCKIFTDKKYQKADWRVRPLPPNMVRYARLDTHYLLYIWKKMKNQLLELENGEVRSLMSVFSESRRICYSVYQNPVVTETSHLVYYNRHRKDFEFSARQMAAFKMLFKWRDEVARQINESPAYVMPKFILFMVVCKMPKDIKSIRECCQSGKPILKRNLMKILIMIRTCLEMEDLDVPPVLSLPRLLLHRPNHHVHDLPPMSQVSNAREYDVVASGIQEPDSASELAPTFYFTEGGDSRFCSPYLRYMKCVNVEETAKEDENGEAAVAGTASVHLEELTPIFRSRETREREAAERAKDNPQGEMDTDNDFADDGFTLVIRRKRNKAGTSPPKHAPYQYAKQNYKTFYTLKH